MKIYTIGHSSYTEEEFIEMLNVPEINFLADVRSYPYSRKYPRFNGEALESLLRDHDIQYQHLGLLGGRRGQSGEVGETLNDGWTSASFHNYADYTLEEGFKEGIAELLAIAEDHTTAIMCSERHPARCHRLIVSNYLAAHDIEVIHIIRSGKSVNLVPHELGEWGAMPIIEDDGEVVYPQLEE